MLSSSQKAAEAVVAAEECAAVVTVAECAMACRGRARVTDDRE